MGTQSSHIEIFFPKMKVINNTKNHFAFTNI